MTFKSRSIIFMSVDKARFPAEPLISHIISISPAVSIYEQVKAINFLNFTCWTPVKPTWSLNILSNTWLTFRNEISLKLGNSPRITRNIFLDSS